MGGAHTTMLSPPRRWREQVRYLDCVFSLLASNSFFSLALHRPKKFAIAKYLFKSIFPTSFFLKKTSQVDFKLSKNDPRIDWESYGLFFRHQILVPKVLRLALLYQHRMCG